MANVNRLIHGAVSLALLCGTLMVAPSVATASQGSSTPNADGNSQSTEPVIPSLGGTQHRILRTHLGPNLCATMRREGALRATDDCVVDSDLAVGPVKIISNSAATTLLRQAAMGRHPYRLASAPRQHLPQTFRRMSSYDGTWWSGWAAIKACASPCGSTWWAQVSYSYICKGNSYQCWLQGSVHCYDDYGGNAGWTVSVTWCGMGTNGTSPINGGDDYEYKDVGWNGVVLSDVHSWQRINVAQINGYGPPPLWPYVTAQGPNELECQGDASKGGTTCRT